MTTSIIISAASEHAFTAKAGGWLPAIAAGVIALAATFWAYRKHRRELRKLRSDRDELIHVAAEMARLRGYVDFVNGRVENLDFEHRRMACLPQSNPRRLELIKSVASRVAPLQEDLEKVLFPGHAPLDQMDWMHKLKTRGFPYSITDEEGLVLYNLVKRLGLRQGYELATAFGYSSFYLGLAFRENHGSMVSMDAYVEEAQQDFVYDSTVARLHATNHQASRRAGASENLPEGLLFALSGARRLDLEKTVRYEIGFSPADVPSVLHGEVIDFAFIDGSHFGDAPCADVDAILPYLNPERCLLVFHDTHCEAVAKAVFHASAAIGGEVHSLNTRNRLVVVSRNIDSKVIDECREILVRQSH